MFQKLFTSFFIFICCISSTLASSFKGELDAFLEGKIIHLENDKGEQIGSIVIDDATFGYDFFTLLGSVNQRFTFNHSLRKVRLTIDGKWFDIYPTADNKATYQPITNANDVSAIYLPETDFRKIKITDFDYQLQFGLGLRYALFKGAFPGYIKGQNQGSFDVPAGKNWNEWAIDSFENKLVNYKFFHEKEAKAVFTALKNQHEKHQHLISNKLKLTNLKINQYFIYSLLYKHNLAAQVLAKRVPKDPHEKLIANFVKGQATPEKQLKAYQSLKIMSKKRGLPQQFNDQIDAINRDWFNGYISKNSPLNFDSSSYQQPQKMKRVLDLYKKKNQRWLPYSDISFDFSIRMHKTFTLIAKLVPSDPPAYQRPVNILATDSYRKLSSREKKRIDKKIAERQYREWQEGTLEPWQRKQSREARYIGSYEHQFEPVLVQIDADISHLTNKSQLEKYLNDQFSNEIYKAKRTTSLPEYEYHEWQFETLWER